MISFMDIRNQVGKGGGMVGVGGGRYRECNLRSKINSTKNWNILIFDIILIAIIGCSSTQAAKSLSAVST